MFIVYKCIFLILTHPRVQLWIAHQSMYIGICGFLLSRLVTTWNNLWKSMSIGFTTSTFTIPYAPWCWNSYHFFPSYPKNIQTSSTSPSFVNIYQHHVFHGHPGTRRCWATAAWASGGWDRWDLRLRPPPSDRSAYKDHDHGFECNR